MNRRLNFVLVLCLTVFIWLPRTAWAWSYHTHRKIVSDALKLMPADFVLRFSPFKEAFLQGSTDPDTSFQDFQYHYYHSHGPEKHQRAAGNLQEVFDSIVDDLKQGKPDQEIARWMGILSHYVADLNQPLHTAGAETDPDEDLHHSRFEKEVETLLSKLSPGEFSFEPVDHPVPNMLAMVEKAKRHYSEIGSAYRTNQTIYDLMPMIQQQYQESVRQVVNYWLGTLKAAQIPFSPNRLPDSSPTLAAVGSAVPLLSVDSAPVDLNSATLEQLIALPGIGKKRAEEIVRARPFKSVYDLARVKSFNIKLVERIKDLIKVSP